MQLALAIREMNEYHWIATYDDNSRIQEFYNGINSQHYDIRYSATNKRRAKEILFNSPITKIESFDNVKFT